MLVGVIAGVVGLTAGGVGGFALGHVRADSPTPSVMDLADDRPAPTDDGASDDESAAKDEPTEEFMEGGTRDDPWHFDGMEVYTEDWSVILDEPRDATDEILAHNDVNVAPPEGMEYWIVPMDVMYLGASAQRAPSGYIDLRFIDEEGNRHKDPCGDIPDGLTAAGPLDTDEATWANACVTVPAGAKGLWALSFDRGFPAYFTTEP